MHSISLQMPRLPVKSLEESSIDAIVTDNDSLAFDDLQVPPEMALEILQRKCKNETLKHQHIEGLIKPGLKRFELELGEEFSKRKLDKILRTVVAKKCRLQVFKLVAGDFSWDTLKEVVTETLSEAKLVDIYQYYGYSSQDKMDDLAFALEKCVNLETLTLGYHALEEDTVKFILTSFPNLKNLSRTIRRRG